MCKNRDNFTTQRNKAKAGKRKEKIDPVPPDTYSTEVTLVSRFFKRFLPNRIAESIRNLHEATVIQSCMTKKSQPCKAKNTCQQRSFQGCTRILKQA